jgi:CheY-like chemotaxis protein
MKLQNRLLVVDDEPAIWSLIKRVAEPLGFVSRFARVVPRVPQLVRSTSPTRSGGCELSCDFVTSAAEPGNTQGSGADSLRNFPTSDIAL